MADRPAYHQPSAANRPLLALAGRPGPLGGVRGLANLARLAGMYALDLDLTGRGRLPDQHALSGIATEQTLRVKSVWLPAALPSAPSAERLIDLLRYARDELGLRSVIVPRRESGKSPELRTRSVLRPLLEEPESSCLRLVIAIDGSDIPSNRDQLSTLAAYKRFAEEWDVDLSLDMSHDADRAWEIEATIVRLMPRLHQVRLPASLDDHGVIGSSRLVNRAITMLADQGFAGTISLLPLQPPFLLRLRPGIAIEHLEVREQQIGLRYQQVARALRPDASNPRLPHGGDTWR